MDMNGKLSHFYHTAGSSLLSLYPAAAPRLGRCASQFDGEELRGRPVGVR